MKDRRGQVGFTIVELLVAMAIFSTVVLGFYTVLFSTQDGTRTAQDVARVSQEARLGLNRLIRDTRESAEFTATSPTSYSLKVDFDGDQAFDVNEYEEITFAYDAVGDRITIDNAATPPDPETLLEGVEPIPGKEIFSFSSNLLEYDTNEDGVTTFAELDTARGNGASLLSSNLLYISHVTFAFTVTSGESTSTFYTQAQVRNARGDTS